MLEICTSGSVRGGGDNVPTYSATQIFLLGAEFTKVYASHHGSHQRDKRRLLPQGS